MNSLARTAPEPKTRVAIALMKRLSSLALQIDALALDIRDRGTVDLSQMVSILDQVAAIEPAALFLNYGPINGTDAESASATLERALETPRPSLSAHGEAEARAMRLAERLAAMSPMAAADWLVMLLEQVDRSSSSSDRLLSRVSDALLGRIRSGGWR